MAYLSEAFGSLSGVGPAQSYLLQAPAKPGDQQSPQSVKPPVKNTQQNGQQMTQQNGQQRTQQNGQQIQQQTLQQNGQQGRAVDGVGDGFNGAMIPMGADMGANARPMPQLSHDAPLRAAPRIEETVEYQMMQQHMKNPFTRQGVPGTGAVGNLVRPMSTCEDYQIHMRNCPVCTEYMRRILNTPLPKSTGLQENFTNTMTQLQTGEMTDLALVVAIGLFVIYAFEILLKLG